MRQWTVDAFASRPFRGNPACVLEPFDAWPDEAWMQALAQENNQAETAYLRRTAEPARFDLRWFTPGLEVDLCGHATLAAAHVLWTELEAQEETLRFDTRSGELTVIRRGDLYELDFPADLPRRAQAPAGLAEALGADPVEVWAARYLVAILATEAEVRAAAPDLSLIQRIAGDAIGGRGNLVIAAEADAGAAFDVVDRFFAPGSGVPEDPTTGSAHCILAPLYAEKLGRSTLRFHQAFPGRGGDLECETKGPRVLLRGRGVTVVESRLRL